MTSSTSDLLSRLQIEWGSPRRVSPDHEAVELYTCRFDIRPAELAELEAVAESIPDDLYEFWGHARRGVLFLDAVHGQWGLEFLSPTDAREETTRAQETRRKTYLRGDLIIGLFRGDSDKLIVRCDRSSTDYGHVTVALL